MVDLEAVSRFFPHPGESDVEDSATRAAIERAWSNVGELAATYERRVGPRWIDRAVRHQVRQILHELRARIEDPEDDRFTLDLPAIELKLLVPWAFSGEFRQDARRPIEAVRFHHFTPRDVVDGVVPVERIKWVLYELRQFAAFAALTNNVAELQWKDPSTGTRLSRRLLTTELDAWLDQETGTRETDASVEGPLEAIERRRELAERFFEPFQIGTGTAPRRNAPHAKDAPDVPPLAFSVDLQSGKHLAGFVALLVWPLVLDQESGRAFFPVALNLVFTAGELKELAPEELAEFWEDLLQEDPDTDSDATTPTTSAKATTSTLSSPEPATQRALVLFDSPVRMDAMAIKAVGFFGDAKLWRKWEKAKTWDALEMDEVARLHETHGEAAFEDAPGIRGPLLRRTWTAAGVEVVELTKEAEEALLEREGPRGFRRVKRDADGIEREYLVKRVPAGRGALTLSFTWYGQALPLSPEARAEEENRLRAEKARDAVALFPASEDERRKRDKALALLGSMKDGARIAHRLLEAFSQQRANPVHLSVDELYLALRCEPDPHRFARVNGALETLRRLEYEYEADGLGPELSGRVRGSFVTEIGQSEGRGPGKHRDVDFYITLSTWAIGCLEVFKQAGGRVKDPRRVFYDWTAKPEKDKVKSLNYVQGFSALASYYDAAAGLTPAQSRLRTWIEDQLTRRKDATAKGRNAHRVHHNAADASEPRVYTSDFCPLLDPSRRYYAALGHADKAFLAEKGRFLRGRSQGRTTTGGPRSGGLLEAMGYELPPGNAFQAREAVAVAALKDLRAVVEEYLGGRVVGRRGDVWLSLQEAERIRAEELLGEVSWYLFLPDDWLDRARKTFEDHHQRRYERGETDRPVRVSTSNAASAGEVGLDATELRVRLHAKRRERELTSDAVGKVFGVSKMTVSKWERGRNAGGAAIPEDLQPLILRWIEKGEGPTDDELKALAARRRGGKKRASL